MVTVRREDGPGLDNRDAGQDSEGDSPLLASPGQAALATLSVEAHVGADVKSIGFAFPDDGQGLLDHPAAPDDQPPPALAQGTIEIGEAVRQEGQAVRRSARPAQQGVIEHERGHYPPRLPGGGAERGLVPDPEIACEQDDSRVHPVAHGVARQASAETRV